MTSTETLPTPQELHQELPASAHHREFIEQTRQQIRKVIDGTDPRLLLIVGPCSIHDVTAAKEYATKLRDLSREMSDTFLIVMRVYFEKPRTTLGWKGMLHDPLLNGSDAIHIGMRWTRQLLLDLAEMGIPAASEFLDPATAYYFGDLISWGCIGARTSSSQTHRQIASGLPMPIAFKNTTDGNVDVAINGALAAASPHTFIGMNAQGKAIVNRTSGNPDCHLALRGGELKPNFDALSITQASNSLRKAGLPTGLLVDCSHDNSRRKHERQISVFQDVINQVCQGNRDIRGLILESHLFAGNQPLSVDASRLRYAVSLTDPCLDWESTENLITWGRSKLAEAENSQIAITMAR